MKYVVDASVAVKWYVPEIFEVEATQLFKGRHELHVPELILPEFSNIIWKKVSRGELSGTEGTKIVNAFTRKAWTIHSHRQTLRSAYAGAEATGQTVYDWTYLALAISLSCEFVTADERFYNAVTVTSLSSNIKWIGDV
ncbi:MAG: type II toxin-antitoxin system VapC family toxin [Pyrinomonadaceae bacterium]